MTHSLRPSRKQRSGHWYWLDRAVVQAHATEVGATAFLVYNFLASMADERQTCFPSQKYIAQRIGYSRTAVNKAVKRLEQCGLIERERRGRTFCHYRLLDLGNPPGETQMQARSNSDVSRRNPNELHEES